MSDRPLAIDTGRNERKEIQGGVLKVRGRTLIFGDAIYPIANISVIEVVRMVRPFPWRTVLFLLAAAATSYFLIDSLINSMTIGYLIIPGVLGFIALGFIMDWVQYGEKTGLQILTNAGPIGSLLIVHHDVAFLRQVALTLRNIIDAEATQVVANFSIDAREIHVEGVSNSSVVVDSKILGNLVNAVS